MKTVGNFSSGIFLSGHIDFFTILTVVPVEDTLLYKTLETIKEDLRISGNISTAGGIDFHENHYADDAAYVFAYEKQQNMNRVCKAIDMRARIAMMSTSVIHSVPNVSTVAASLNGHVSDFGSEYSGKAGTLYTLKFATDFKDVWESEFDLASTLHGIFIKDSKNILEGAKLTDTVSSDLLNTIVLKNEFL